MGIDWKVNAHVGTSLASSAASSRRPDTMSSRLPLSEEFEESPTVFVGNLGALSCSGPETPQETRSLSSRGPVTVRTHSGLLFLHRRETMRSGTGRGYTGRCLMG